MNDTVFYRIERLFDCIRSMSPLNESRNRSRRCIKPCARRAKSISHQFGFATLGYIFDGVHFVNQATKLLAGACIGKSPGSVEGGTGAEMRYSQPFGSVFCTLCR
jgi:hypothetical protein